MQFEKLNFDNVHKLTPFLTQQKVALCDYTPATLAMWSNFYCYEFAVCDGCAFVRSLTLFSPGEISYMVLGDVEKGVQLLKEFCPKGKISLSPVDCHSLEFLKTQKGFVANKLENWSDYVYLAENFATLKGKKYNQKRNHVKRFSKYNWSCATLSDDNFEKVVDFLQKVSVQSVQALHELVATVNLLKHRQLFDLHTLILSVDNQVVGFTLAEAKGDTLVVHTERADKNFEGSFEALAHNFAKINQQFTYLNREEDMGIDGLKKAKHSWHPIFMLDKYEVFIDND